MSLRPQHRQKQPYNQVRSNPVAQSESPPMVEPIQADNRESREQQSRCYDDIHPAYDPNWEPPKQTGAPPARNGMEQLWVRTTMLGEDDAANVHKHMMEGWKPRSAGTIPSGFFFSKISFGEYGDVIANSDSILMERPSWMGDKVRSMQAAANMNKVRGIAQYVRGRMPNAAGTKGGEVDINIRTVTGREPKIADD